jgi:hypothetical protein
VTLDIIDALDGSIIVTSRRLQVFMIFGNLTEQIIAEILQFK